MTNGNYQPTGIEKNQFLIYRPSSILSYICFLLFAHSMMSHLSCRVGMGGIRELLDGKIWEWDLSFRWEWEWDGSGNEVIEMGGNWYEKSVPAHPRLQVPPSFK